MGGSILAFEAMDVPDPTTALEVAEVKELLSLAGPIVRFLVQRIPAVQERQAVRVLERIVTVLDRPESEVAGRMAEDPRVFRLVWDTLHAAARADSEAKMEALAAVASGGIRDTALLDEARYLVGVLGELDIIHVRVLVAAEQLGSQDPEQRKAGLKVAPAVGVSQGTAEALTGDLLRLGLVETTGMSFRGLHSEVFLSPLGREALRLLRSGEWNPSVVEEE